MPDPGFVRPIEIAIEPKRPEDRERLLAVISEIAEAGPDFAHKLDTESGQLILEGPSELALDRLVDGIINERGIPVLIGQPRVAYRETITKEATVDYTHKKQTGGSGQFARVKIVVKPGEPGTGFTFENEVIGGSIPKEFIPAVEKGVKSIMDAGPLIGFPVLDVAVDLVDGAYHEVDSSAIAFEIAARTAMRDALTKAGPKLLEPVMIVEIMTPAEFVTAITRDLNTRRAVFLPGDGSGPRHRIAAHVPLGNMFGYQSSLRAIARDRATWTMAFSHYAVVPPNDRGPDTFGPAVALRG